jgi:hypothetical protein
MENSADSPVKHSGRGLILALTTGLLCVLTVLSVFGAFLGSRRAAVFFNTPATSSFWILLAAVFVTGFLAVRSLRRNTGLFLCHFGCLLVMLGALWGSETAHTLRARFFGDTKVREGIMQIHEGHQENRIFSPESEGDVLATLPFNVALDDFYIEYYESEGSLEIGAPDGRSASLKAEPGKQASLGADVPEVRVVRVFQNFRIQMEGGRKTVWDEEGDGMNPALEVGLTLPDGSNVMRYVFAQALHDHSFSYDGLSLNYVYGGPSAIRDFKSALAIVEDGKVTARKTIEVNKPMHYGGYSFYQSGYDQQNGHYTVLSVVSDSGLMLVFPGYAFLCLGVAWRCWFRHSGVKSRAVAP